VAWFCCFDVAMGNNKRALGRGGADCTRRGTTIEARRDCHADHCQDWKTRMFVGEQRVQQEETEG
jgi:hypothetical protein